MKILDDSATLIKNLEYKTKRKILLTNAKNLRMHSGDGDGDSNGDDDISFDVLEIASCCLSTL